MESLEARGWWKKLEAVMDEKVQKMAEDWKAGCKATEARCSQMVEALQDKLQEKRIQQDKFQDKLQDPAVPATSTSNASENVSMEGMTAFVMERIAEVKLQTDLLAAKVEALSDGLSSVKLELPAIEKLLSSVRLADTDVQCLRKKQKADYDSILDRIMALERDACSVASVSCRVSCSVLSVSEERANDPEVTICEPSMNTEAELESAFTLDVSALSSVAHEAQRSDLEAEVNNVPRLRPPTPDPSAELDQIMNDVNVEAEICRAWRQS